jgi:hypothetical protein
MSDWVGDAIAACEPVEAELVRYLPPPMVDGQVVGELEESSIPVLCSIQPMTQKELQLLPEGMRARGRVKIYTQTEMHTVERSECNVPDRVRYRDVEYLVEMVDTWLDQADYYKVIAVRTTR